MTCEIGNLLTNKKSKNKQRVLFICVQNIRKRERERGDNGLLITLAPKVLK